MLRPRVLPAALAFPAALTLLVAGTARPAAAQADPAPFTFHELGPGVVAAVVIPDVASYAFANSLIVVGEDGVLVVDTQQNPRPARAVLDEVRRRTDRPVRWVVNTHAHADHVWGNAVYAAAFPDVEVLATRAARDSIVAGFERDVEEQRAGTVESRRRLETMLEEETDPERRERIAAAIAVRDRYLDDLDTLRLVPPGRTVDGRLHLDLGGREVVLFEVGPAHTPGDLVVWLPAEDIVMVGDLLEEGGLWLEGADLRGWAEALATIHALEPETLVMGHGSVQTDLTLLREQWAELRSLVEEER